MAGFARAVSRGAAREEKNVQGAKDPDRLSLFDRSRRRILLPSRHAGAQRRMDALRLADTDFRRRDGTRDLRSGRNEGPGGPKIFGGPEALGALARLSLGRNPSSKKKSRPDRKLERAQKRRLAAI